MNLVKSNLILAGAVLALAVPTALTVLGERELFTDVSQIPKLFDGFNEDNVAAVILGVPKDPQPEPAPNADPNKPPQVQYDQLVFQRAADRDGFVLGQGNGELTGVPVNNQLLDTHVFAHLDAIKADRDALVLEDATEEQLEDYGLDIEHAFVIKALNAQNQPVAELLVGPAAKPRGTESVNGVFVRTPSSADVILYEGEGPSRAQPFTMRQVDPALWVDKTVLRVSADQIRSISLRNEVMGEKPVVFERSESVAQWACPEPPPGKGAPRQVEVDRFVQSLQNLMCQSYVGALQGKNIAGLGLYPGKSELVIEYVQDGEDKTITIWSGDVVDGKNEVYLRTSASNFLMTWVSYYGDRLATDLNPMFDPAAPTTDPDKPGEDKDGDKEDGGKDDGGKDEDR